MSATAIQCVRCNSRTAFRTRYGWKCDTCGYSEHSLKHSLCNTCGSVEIEDKCTNEHCTTLPTCRYCGTAGKSVCDKCEERLWDLTRGQWLDGADQTRAQEAAAMMLQRFHAKLKEVAE